MFARDKCNKSFEIHNQYLQLGQVKILQDTFFTAVKLSARANILYRINKRRP